MTRIYIGTAAQLLGTGALIGVLLGWLLTRWYFVGILRRIQRKVASLRVAQSLDAPAAERIARHELETELRRRKL